MPLYLYFSHCPPRILCAARRSEVSVGHSDIVDSEPIGQCSIVTTQSYIIHHSCLLDSGSQKLSVP